MVMVEGHLSSESWTIRGLRYQIAEWNKDCAYWICKQQAERDCSMWENPGELHFLQNTRAIGGEGRAGNTWQCSSSVGEVWDCTGCTEWYNVILLWKQQKSLFLYIRIKGYHCSGT